MGGGCLPPHPTVSRAMGSVVAARRRAVPPDTPVHRELSTRSLERSATM